MMLCGVLFAYLLSAGNAQFEKTAIEGAFDIAVQRERMRLVADGPATGELARAMLADPQSFAKADGARETAWKVYRELLVRAIEAVRKDAGEKLGYDGYAQGCACFAESDLAQARKRFDVLYAEERAMACAEQAVSLVGTVRPSECEFETKDRNVLVREMCARVAARQKAPVFEENLAYISEKIVGPVLASAERERKRQGEYLRKIRCDVRAPSALKTELTERLVLNVRERKEKGDDAAMAWDVFPSVTNVMLGHVVHRRTMDRLAAKIADTPLDVSDDFVARTIAADRLGHRRADASAGIFRKLWTHDLLRLSMDALLDEMPPDDRRELADYLKRHMSDGIVVKFMDRRLDADLLPALRERRLALSQSEFAATWPMLANRTWQPGTDTADRMSARSDFTEAVRTWREMADVSLPKGVGVLEESAKRADDSVAGIFETARGAVAAQTRMVDEAQPDVMAEALARKNSLWRLTPDFGGLVKMLTEAVEMRWKVEKVGALWPRGDAPENASDQYAELFPSVKRRIELVAKDILSAMDRPESEEQPVKTEILCSIAISREGDRVAVRLDQDGNTLAERKTKAKLDDFRTAMKEISEKLGREVMRLK